MRLAICALIGMVYGMIVDPFRNPTVEGFAGLVLLGAWVIWFTYEDAEAAP